MTSQTSDVTEIRVDKMSFIVSGTMDIDRIYRALLEVLDDDASGGRVVIRERGVDTIEVPRHHSDFDALFVNPLTLMHCLFCVRRAHVHIYAATRTWL